MPPEASTRGEGFAGVERSFWLAKLRIGIRVRGMRPVVAGIQDRILVVEGAHGQRGRLPRFGRKCCACFSSSTGSDRGARCCAANWSPAAGARASQ